MHLEETLPPGAPSCFLLAIHLGDVGYTSVSRNSFPSLVFFFFKASNECGLTDEVNDTAGVTPLVVVPGDELDEVRVEGDTGLGIEDGGVVVTVEVGGDNLVLGVAEDALELTLGGGLENLLNLVVGGGLLDTASKVDDGDVGGRDTHGHTGQLAVKGGDDLADSLGGTGGGGDDVLGGGTATSPVLGGGGVDGLLGGSVGVDSGHETLKETELVVDNLGEGSQAVGGAGGVGEDVDVSLVVGVVDTHDEHGGVSGGGRDDDLLGTTLQVSGGLVVGGEDTGGLDDVGGTGLAPGDRGRVLLLEEADLLAVDDEALGVDLNGALEPAVGAVIPKHVGGVGDVDERVVDGNDLDVITVDGVTEDLNGRLDPRTR